MGAKSKIYVASPLGFSEVGNFFMNKKLFPLLLKMDFEIIDPWRLTSPDIIKHVNDLPYSIERKNKWSETNAVIGKNNANGIDECEIMLAVLDGVDVDSGTAAEIGYAAAKSKQILGYRGDFRLSADNEGSIVNLQVEYFILSSGGEIVTKFEDIEDRLQKIKQYKHFDI